MIPEPTRELIRADLRAGLSQRVVAAKHGVALGTVTTLNKTLNGPAPARAPKAPREPRAPREPAAAREPRAAPGPAPTWSPSSARMKQVEEDITAAEGLAKACQEKNQLTAAVAAFKSVTLLRRELARLRAEVEAAKISDPIAQTAARVSIMVADGSHAAAAALAGQLTKQKEKDAAARAAAQRKAEAEMGDAEHLAKLEEECRDAPDAELAVAVRVYCERHNLPMPTRVHAGGIR